MKKILLSLSAVCIMFMVACGPSAEEKAAMEKAAQDSIAASQKAIDDSIAAVQNAIMEKAKADSTIAADMEKARQDSVDAAKKKSSSKPKKTTPAPEKVMPGQGRGK